MKKTIAILLCFILLFNWAGYRLLITWLQEKDGIAFDAMLDKDRYDESQLISVKVPAVHLISYSHTSGFLRTSGEVEIGGVQYRYVKKRFYNDSLEYLCIPDASAMRWRTAKNEFFNQVNGLQHNGQSKKADSFSGCSRTLCIESCQYNNARLSQPAGDGAVISPGSSRYLFQIPSVFLLTAGHPPETLS